MIKENEYCTLEICRTLQQLGYQEGSKLYIVEYKRNYIVDNEDLDYHGNVFKGQIEVQPIYYNNKEYKSNDLYDMFEYPTIYEVQKWLRDKYHLNLMPHFDNFINKWKYRVDEFGRAMTVTKVSSDEVSFNNAEDAIKTGIKYCLEIVQMIQNETYF